MYHSLPRRLLLTCAAAALTFGAAACGGDDDEGGAADTTAAGAAVDTTAGAATDTTEAMADTTEATDTTAADGTAPDGTTDGTAAGGAAIDVFCQAELEAEAAARSEDPSQAGPAFEALVAAAPDEIRESVEAVIAAAEQGPGTPEFDEPYAEMIEYMRENCGFNELEVTGDEYTFTGIPAEVEAGPTIFVFENTGEEVHEMILIRKNEGVTESATELLELPEEELITMASFQAAAFSFPGVTTYTATDLEPGSYFAVCFLPEGATPEVMEELMAEEGPPGEGTAPDGTAPDGTSPDGTSPEGTAPGGPPHFTLGMIQEFEVA